MEIRQKCAIYDKKNLLHCIVYCIICDFFKLLKLLYRFHVLYVKFVPRAHDYLKICLFAKAIILLNLFDFNTHTHIYT